jgi:hypothetical protein
MNNIRTHTHRTSKKNICYRKREGEHAHARELVRSALFSPSNGRRAKEEKRKKKKGEAAIVTGASNQASERCRYILYWTRKSSNKAKD